MSYFDSIIPSNICYTSTGSEISGFVRTTSGSNICIALPRQLYKVKLKKAVNVGP